MVVPIPLRLVVLVTSLSTLGPLQNVNSYTLITQQTIYHAVRSWIKDPDSAVKTYGHIKTWDTSHVTSLSNLFRSQKTFNDDISTWDVSSVTSLTGTFAEATAFNVDVSRWNVSSVTDMS
eukprot:CAMPEP_0172508394 /NCGR_PEP_ID=MMETSP1066-20121228/211682_1 /TAXON_ID=671091 /ORGANISM="Coscinodiscus wailesii, Strain CCMP2513" /LENGTH=119 /DNA_ID=CAMNT_0013286357 /DNA_START=38 /DNA_END=393 /DNA_ORIENTATION=+